MKECVSFFLFLSAFIACQKQTKCDVAENQFHKNENAKKKKTKSMPSG
jgi:hypothetical protein